MNTNIPGGNAGLDAALRSLDAAAPVTETQQRNAAATLDRIMATAPDADQAVRASHRSAGGVTPPARRALLLLSAAAAAVTAAVIVLTPGGDRVYASWTPEPTALTAAEIDIVAPACRKRLRGSMLDLDRAKLVLAERRGEYVALLYRTDNPDMSGSCLAHHLPGTDDVDDVLAGMGGSSGPARTAPTQGFTQGAIADYRDASITDGAAGTDVTALTIHASDLTVEATVRNGRYVAWWPGSAFERDRDDPDGPETDLRLTITYDLTLTDGTVITNAQPTLPS